MEPKSESPNAQPVKELYGRQYNNINEQYQLPSATDEEEATRLTCNMHIAIGKVWPLRCGTGRWAIEMAHRFPHVSVLGLDLVPHLQAPDEPENVRFQTYDINKGMSQFHGQYDMIQMRCALAGITNSESTVKDLLMSLKPGGLLMVMEGDRLVEADRIKLVAVAKVEGSETDSSANDNESWLARILHEAATGNALNGADVAQSYDAFDHGLWSHPLCDPETARAASVFVPVGPWATDPDPVKSRKLQIVGALMQQAFLSLHAAFRPLFLQHGLEEASVDEWIRKATQEIQTMNPRVWGRLRYCWGRRRSADGSPAPAPPNPLGSDLEAPYPAIEIYRTQEEAMEAARRRNESRIPPKAEVEKAWEKKQK
ncbi:hypothetical protein CPB86DRAFT_789361 [Serendipita vermifera]|nr:hypothetical protein CPB86DRAFT_789361 [Serendipita vermifera]